MVNKGDHNYNDLKRENSLVKTRLPNRDQYSQTPDKAPKHAQPSAIPKTETKRHAIGSNYFYKFYYNIMKIDNFIIWTLNPE